MLSGWMFSGKDTLGRMLVDKGFCRLAFADALKDSVASVFGISRTSMDSADGKRTVWHDQKTVRGLLIEYGMMCRGLKPTVWSDRVVRQIRGRPARYVITDWRFPEEHEQMVKAFGAEAVTTVRIFRQAKPPLIDFTEQALDSYAFDHVLANTGSFDALLVRVEALSQRLTRPLQQQREGDLSPRISSEREGPNTETKCFQIWP